MSVGDGNQEEERLSPEEEQGKPSSGESGGKQHALQIGHRGGWLQHLQVWC